MFAKIINSQHFFLSEMVFPVDDRITLSDERKRNS